MRWAQAGMRPAKAALQAAEARIRIRGTAGRGGARAEGERGSAPRPRSKGGGGAEIAGRAQLRWIHQRSENTRTCNADVCVCVDPVLPAAGS